ncbi:hypothetical protein [Paraburkholderia xenovorans]
MLPPAGIQAARILALWHVALLGCGVVFAAVLVAEFAAEFAAELAAEFAAEFAAYLFARALRSRGAGGLRHFFPRP